MKALLVFDQEKIPYRKLSRVFSSISAFRLTADARMEERIGKIFQQLNTEFSLLDSTAMVKREALMRKDEFVEWAGKIADIPLNGKTLREHLVLPDGGISAWWFGLLADKDPVKNKLFLRLAQANAIISAIENSQSEVAVIALRDADFQKRLVYFLKENGIKCLAIKNQLPPLGRLRKIRILRGFTAFREAVINYLYLKRKMPDLKGRGKAFRNALLCVTYFPYFKKADEKRSVFTNDYFSQVQSLCKENNKDIAWILIYPASDGLSLKAASDSAKRFIANGEKMFFYQEFLGPGLLAGAFWQYIRLIIKWALLRLTLNPALIDRAIGKKSLGIFFLDILDDSFYGEYALTGMIQYAAFKRIFAQVSGVSHCLYTCEMMGWEYALNAARKSCGNPALTIGYQDFAISPFYFQMFHARQESRAKATAALIPLPEIIACCGKITQQMLGRYYDNLENVETLRHLYLGRVLEAQAGIRRQKRDKCTLLVCTNIDLNESKVLIDLLNAAYPSGTTEPEIWLREHPCLPMSRIYEECGIVLEGSNFRIIQGDLRECLPASDIVLTGGSSVVIDALAFGCEVLIHTNPEMLNFSPLLGLTRYCREITDPESLIKAVRQITAGINPETSISEKQDFVREYWNLNPALDGFRRILNLETAILRRN